MADIEPDESPHQIASSWQLADIQIPRGSCHHYDIDQHKHVARLDREHNNQTRTRFRLHTNCDPDSVAISAASGWGRWNLVKGRFGLLPLVW